VRDSHLEAFPAATAAVKRRTNLTRSNQSNNVLSGNDSYEMMVLLSSADQKVRPVE
jgi:hypothetical protein